MLLILVLALLFCPSLAEEELRGVKHKNMLVGGAYYKEIEIPSCNKKKSGPIPLRQKTHAQVP